MFDAKTRSVKRDWSDEDFPLPKKPVRLPVILSQDEITAFFASVASLKQRTILMTAYAAGLGVSEVVHLKLTDESAPKRGLRSDFTQEHNEPPTMCACPSFLNRRSPSSSCESACEA
ncbi:hypothetical protein AB4156_36095 [Cupriavidus sp. 2MCAB6]|uniref:hypothetical protein n=1 Tax=Cupriavidus sp. 2MCAB6 TaxID=3232981 RepID=UPI003F907F98